MLFSIFRREPMVNTKVTPRKREMEEPKLICPVCKKDLPKNQTFEQHVIACARDKVEKLSQCKVCKVTFIRDEYKRRHMARAHGLAQQGDHSDWDSDPDVEVADPCARKRSMPNPVIAPVKKAKFGAEQQLKVKFPAPTKKPVPSTATVQSNKSPLDHGQVSAGHAVKHDQPQASAKGADTRRVSIVARDTKKLNTQGTQTEKQEVEMPSAEDRGMQTDQVQSSDTDGKKACCRFCEIEFSDSLMSCMHPGIHAVDNPLRCNVCGHLCHDKLEFFSHITWGHK